MSLPHDLTSVIVGERPSPVGRDEGGWIPRAQAQVLGAQRHAMGDPESGTQRGVPLRPGGISLGPGGDGVVQGDDPADVGPTVGREPHPLDDAPVLEHRELVGRALREGAHQVARTIGEGAGRREDPHGRLQLRRLEGRLDVPPGDGIHGPTHGREDAHRVGQVLLEGGGELVIARVALSPAFDAVEVPVRIDQDLRDRGSRPSLSRGRPRRPDPPRPGCWPGR